MIRSTNVQPHVSAYAAASATVWKWESAVCVLRVHARHASAAVAPKVLSSWLLVFKDDCARARVCLAGYRLSASMVGQGVRLVGERFKA